MAERFHDFEVTALDGQPVRLSRYAGKVCLVVNVASRCGLAQRNYSDLEPLQRRYRDQGFCVLAFPANDFLRQEPGSARDIREFCTTRFDVTFDLFAKVHVRGPDICPLYAFLTRYPDPAIAGPVRWNFQKYLVDRRGVVIARFGPLTRPGGRKVVTRIERALAEPVPT